MKKFIFILGIVAVIPFFNSCSSGYVAQEPIYQTYHRPVRPSNDYVWIEGGWHWNKSTRTYTQENGHWMRQDQVRKNKKGHWQKNRRGSRWVR